MIYLLPDFSTIDDLLPNFVDKDIIIFAISRMTVYAVPFAFCWAWGRKCIRAILDFVFKGDSNAI